MGAWGYKPFDNDAARDWIFDFEKKIERTLKRYTRQRGAMMHGRRWYDGQEEALAALETALVLADSHGGMALELAELCKRTLEKLQADRAFIDSWKSPRRYRRILKAVEARVDAAHARAVIDRRALERMFRGKAKPKRRRPK